MTLDPDVLAALDAYAAAQRLDRSSMANRMLAEACGIMQPWRIGKQRLEG